MWVVMSLDKENWVSNQTRYLHRHACKIGYLKTVKYKQLLCKQRRRGVGERGKLRRTLASKRSSCLHVWKNTRVLHQECMNANDKALGVAVSDVFDSLYWTQASRKVPALCCEHDPPQLQCLRVHVCVDLHHASALANRSSVAFFRGVCRNIFLI